MMIEIIKARLPSDPAINDPERLYYSNDIYSATMRNPKVIVDSIHSMIPIRLVDLSDCE